MEKNPTYTTKTCRKTYFIFSTYTFIPSYTFIIFGGNFIPTRLFHPAQLLGRLEYISMIKWPEVGEKWSEKSDILYVWLIWG